MAKSGAETARERVAAGKCCSCSQPATHGVRCEKHALEAKQKAAERYQARKAAGLCGMCGKSQKEQGRECCRVCLDKSNEAGKIVRAGKPPETQTQTPEPETLSQESPTQVFDKPWHQRNKEAGFCITGGEKHDRPRIGYTTCDYCLQKKKDRVERLLTAGVCVSGDGSAVVPGSRYCEKCRDKVLERLRERSRRRVEAGMCVCCGVTPPRSGQRLCDDCAIYSNARDKAKRKRLRKQVLEKYSEKIHCFCCHEGNPDLLEIDHVNNDGSEHRKKIGKTSLRLYTWLRLNGFPPGFQLACATCNKAKFRHGQCPHQILPPELLERLRTVNEEIARTVREAEAMDDLPSSQVQSESPR